MIRSRVLIIGSLVFVLAALGFLGISSAQEIRTGNKSDIAANQTIDSTLFAAGNTVTIAGTVNGDVFCAGQTVDISGTVNGDVFCAGQTVSLSGVVNGGARLAGQNVNVSGKVTGNISLAGASVGISSTGNAEKDVQAVGATLVVHGKIGRDLMSGARDVSITGQIGRNANVKDESLLINSQAKIGGNLKYQSTEPATISQGTVSGTITKTNPPSHAKTRASVAFALTYAYWFAALLLIALVVVALFPRQLSDSFKSANSKPLATFARGLLAVFIPPIIILLITLSIIGIPLAILLWLLYSVTLMLSGPFAAFFVGNKFLPGQKPWVQMLLGTLVVLIVFAIPFINILAFLAVTIFGTGMFASVILERLPKQSK